MNKFQQYIHMAIKLKEIRTNLTPLQKMDFHIQYKMFKLKKELRKEVYDIYNIPISKEMLRDFQLSYIGHMDSDVNKEFKKIYIHDFDENDIDSTFYRMTFIGDYAIADKEEKVTVSIIGDTLSIDSEVGSISTASEHINESIFTGCEFLFRTIRSVIVEYLLLYLY